MSEATTSGPTQAFLTRLGEKVRTRRQAAGMTVQQLAAAAGLSRRILTQIELGQANPSLATVDKVARALRLDFASLISDTHVDAVVVNPPGSDLQVWASSAGSRTALQIATTGVQPAELWDSRLAPGDRYQAHPDPPGSEELLLVLAGELTLEVDGHEPVNVDVGGSVRLSSDRAYAFANNGSVEVRVVRVVQLGMPPSE